MRFDVVLADPPWEYDDPKGNMSSMGGTPYTQVSFERLAMIPMSGVVADDCALFLWATRPKLPEAFQLMDAWGFRYVTTVFTWVKTRGGGVFKGIGHWTQGNTEVVLLGVRGHPKRATKDISEVVVAEVTRHSEKPPEVHRRIERLMGPCRRLEMFARRRVPGWTCVGNELTGRDMTDDLAALAQDDELPVIEQEDQGRLWAVGG